MEETLLAMRKWLATNCFTPIGNWIFPWVEWINPDWLTIARIPMAIIVVIILWSAWHAPWLWLAELTFVLACLSDIADGWLARKKEVDQRENGKIIDGIADRTLFGLVSISLALLVENRMLSMLVGLTIFLDLPFWVVSNSDQSKTEHNIFGKTKMTTQSIALSVLILLPINEKFLDVSFFLLFLVLALIAKNVVKHLKT